MAEPIKFYFDFNSTFSYIAIQRIDELAAKNGRNVDWRAISLGHLFQAQNITPPPSLPAKFKYLSIDFPRSCAMAGLPCKMPASFPPDVRLARYVFWHLKAKDEGLSHRFSKLVSAAIFGRGEDMATAAHLAQACGSLGLTEAAIEAAGSDSAAKKAVVNALDGAVADGMIGAPFFVVDGEAFWGADRLDQLDWRLSGKR